MTNLELSKTILTDSNCWHRHFYRCWINGSYNGEEHYKLNCSFARRSSDKALRGRAIDEWCSFMAAEFDCSPSTVRRHMVDYFTAAELEQLNAKLVDDLRDLIAD